MEFARPFFGGNWKMNHGPSDTRSFVEKFLKHYDPQPDRTVVFFPPALSLATFQSATAGRADLLLGVQDVYWEESGAFTGSISALMAKDAGARFALAGHSERRHIFGHVRGGVVAINPEDGRRRVGDNHRQARAVHVQRGAQMGHRAGPERDQIVIEDGVARKQADPVNPAGIEQPVRIRGSFQRF